MTTGSSPRIALLAAKPTACGRLLPTRIYGSIERRSRMSVTTCWSATPYIILNRVASVMPRVIAAPHARMYQKIQSCSAKAEALATSAASCPFELMKMGSCPRRALAFAASQNIRVSSMRRYIVRMSSADKSSSRRAGRSRIFPASESNMRGFRLCTDTVSSIISLLHADRDADLQVTGERRASAVLGVRLAPQHRLSMHGTHEAHSALGLQYIVPGCRRCGSRCVLTYEIFP